MRNLPLTLAAVIAAIAVTVGLFTTLGDDDGATAIAAGGGSRSVTSGEADGASGDDDATEQIAPSSGEGEVAAASPAAGGANLSAQELADQIVELDTAVDIPELRTGPAPVAISFPSIGVNEAPIDGVGIEPNGEMEVPGPRRVGWYEFGPSPGQEGSSVLAAHIASEGIDGIFRRLDRAKPGDRFEVIFDNGDRQSYEVIELEQYNKADLPLDRVFGRTGDPVVTLITCGGAFQPSVRSYEDNVVAYAVPVAP
ncbi:MAG: class F sortase [Actinomycetota bacterium]